jgi:hypothetical protein
MKHTIKFRHTIIADYSIEIEAETEQEAVKIFEKYDNPFEEMEKQNANMSPYYEDSYCEVITNNVIQDVDFEE